ncbi:YqhG family protein [Paenibacillus chartarius]|uniref:YqhG family protein n=1 Tax=Paenibacillus chartarius TaxID=747481 RepID=A0ABV6DEW2_9BACL
MNAEQIRSFVHAYLEAYQCDIVEKAPTHVTVKLSVEADKELTNRAYYWGFVERTGAPAETMTMTFVFDPPAYQALKSAKPFSGGGRPGQPGQPAAGPGAQGSAAGLASAAPAGGGSASSAAAGGGAAGPTGGAAATTGAGSASGIGSASGAGVVGAGGIAARSGTSGAAVSSGTAAGYRSAPGGQMGPSAPASRPGIGGPPAPGTGAVVSAVQGAPGTSDSILGRYFGFVPTTVTARVPTDDVTFGSRRLQQLFQSAKTRGRFVRMFEEPRETANGRAPAYETWLHVNFKVELVCDMKRSEVHSLAIGLASGIIRERFFEEELLKRKLTARLPDNIRLLPDVLPYGEAAARLEAHVEQTVRSYDHRWAELAGEHLREELERIDAYYGTLLQNADPEQKPDIEAQYDNRKREIDWQYRPRIEVSVINCGFFHLQAEAAQT